MRSTRAQSGAAGDAPRSRRPLHRIRRLHSTPTAALCGHKLPGQSLVSINTDQSLRDQVTTSVSSSTSSDFASEYPVTSQKAGANSIRGSQPVPAASRSASRTILDGRRDRKGQPRWHSRRAGAAVQAQRRKAPRPRSVGQRLQHSALRQPAAGTIKDCNSRSRQVQQSQRVARLLPGH